MKFDVRATIEVDVQATVEADNYQDAEELMDSAIWDLDTGEEDVCCTEATQNSVEVDECTNLNEQKWDGMSATDKVAFLTEQGVGGKTACEIVANEEDHVSEIEEYWENLKID